MLEPASLVGDIAGFLAERTFLVMAGRDAGDRLWTTALLGSPGFLRVISEAELAIHAALPVGDPLHELPAGQRVGMITIEFATRRRVRLNGTLASVGGDALRVDVEQAYGNCRKYIQPRILQPVDAAPLELHEIRHDVALSAEDTALIRSADTFFIGTTYPGRGTDASHRGGPVGFVRVEGNRLWWPDYRGNNMFNTLGNLAVDPEASLLFIDFATGRTVQLAGRGVVEFDHAGEPGDDGGTGRRVVFDAESVVSGRLLGARETDHAPYERNPAITD